jgi:hypothetical protein
MRRLLPLALLVGLVAAAPAAGAGVPKTAIGSVNPIAVSATVNPPVQTFGDSITARVTMLADTRLVDPARIRLIAPAFAPFQQTAPPTVVRTVSGRLLQETWTWSLRCLTKACVPTVPPSDVYHFFRFTPAHVHYLGLDGKIRLNFPAFFPLVELVSEVSPGIVNYLANNKVINWQYQLSPATATGYRLPPGLVFWAALAIAAVLAAAGLAVAARWALRFRAPPVLAPALPPSYLERALALFFWANARGDETLQRKALERVADELPLDVIDLSETARALAWSPETPEGEEVEAISERAGVPAHHEDGAGG